jgi:ubiquinone/menaquinone biosynthesis C-methylase UbiE
MEGLYQELAEAYARGMLPEAANAADGADLIEQARAAGLKLHRFKRTMDLPRVRAVLGALHGLAPESLIDFGSGRGVFLWPLLDAFTALPVTAVERDERRLDHLEAVRRGGVERLTVTRGDASTLPFSDANFDGATVLEVLEHQDDPLPLAREAVRLARRFVIASVPSKPDDNPEHVQLFTGETLKALLTEAGAARVGIDYVLGHIIAVARVER